VCKGVDKGVVASNSVDLNSKRRQNNVYQPFGRSYTILTHYTTVEQLQGWWKLHVSLSRQFKDRVDERFTWYHKAVYEAWTKLERWKQKNVLSLVIVISNFYRLRIVLISRQWPQNPRPSKLAPIIFTQL
jgi:hypothetical protein